MTGSRTNPALPQRICAITALEKAHNHTTPGFRHQTDSMHQTGPASRPFVLANAAGAPSLTPTLV
ncbi:hypothetical protein MSIMFB_05080 [Mycobacterium simulans]|uniref:Uncharacterized protein n=1 Tax=Mycobacterium simulans TaxID=627089 RepID=A0A7Z7IPW2_9MYCO|nr:hypothetical protein MSIMFB_05080 [Mycobacterium simulans]